MEPAPNMASKPEQQLQLLVESVKDYAIFLLDPQGRIATWNQGAESWKQSSKSSPRLFSRHRRVCWSCL